MRKRGLLVVGLFVMILVSSFVLAQDETTDGVNVSIEEKGYACINNLIPDSGKVSLEEAVFSVLALGSQKNLVATIEGMKSERESCWPAKKCTLKDTALVALAYDRIGKDNKEVLNWITSKNKTTTDLIWYLQIDIDNQDAAECTVNYTKGSTKVKVLDDMSLEGTSLGCFEISNKYWLKIKEECLDRTIEVTCNKGFTTSLLYQKKTGDTVYVTSTTKSSVSDGYKDQKVNAKCISVDGKCDYEGNLWAALALNKAGIDTEEYTPFLLSLSDDNTKYFPSAFLYALTSDNDQYTEMLDKQAVEGYWDITGSPYKKYYDSALALMAIGSSGAEIDQVKLYLENTQTKAGCWDNDNLRNTAFLLYAGWPKSIRNIIVGPEVKDCEELGNSCERISECEAAGGSVLSDLSNSCIGIGRGCCSITVEEKTCSEQGGTLCELEQTCEDGEIIPSSDYGECCFAGTCKDVEVVVDTCESEAEGACRYSCEDGEEEISETCAAEGKVCCITTDTEEAGGFPWLWVLLFAVLITIVVLAIIYRDKLRMWILKVRGQVKSEPINRPGVPTGAYPMMTRPVLRAPAGVSPRPLPRTQSPKEKEFEDTLKRLRGAGK